MTLGTESSAPSAAERRESVGEFQSLIVWGEETALVNVSISQGDLKCQRVMPSDMPKEGGGGRRGGGQGHSYLCKA